jgi:hypothetical protein
MKNAEILESRIVKKWRNKSGDQLSEISPNFMSNKLTKNSKHKIQVGHNSSSPIPQTKWA